MSVLPNCISLLLHLFQSLIKSLAEIGGFFIQLLGFNFNFISAVIHALDNASHGKRHGQLTSLIHRLPSSQIVQVIAANGFANHLFMVVIKASARHF